MRPSQDRAALLRWAFVALVIVAAIVAFFIFAPDVEPLARDAGR